MAKNGNGKHHEPEQAAPESEGPTAILQADTLRGDIRDQILAEFKHLPDAWQKMTEDQQACAIHRADQIAEELVAGAVAAIAPRGFSNIIASMEQFTRKDGLKVVLKAAATVDAITKLAEHGMNAVVLVLAEPAKFMGERKPAETDNVGDLAMPKTGPGSPSDPAALEQLGRGPVAH